MPENVKQLLADSVKKQKEAIEKQRQLGENITTEVEAEQERSGNKR